MAQLNHRPLADETDLIAARISRILSRLLVMGRAQPIKPELRLAEDLRVDSIDRVMIAMAVEEEWEIAIADDEAAALATVGDIIALVRQRLATRRQLLFPVISAEDAA